MEELDLLGSLEEEVETLESEFERDLVEKTSREKHEELDDLLKEIHSQIETLRKLSKSKD